jgi:hypothetical protein
MKTMFRILAALLALSSAQLASAQVISGDVTGGGNYAGVVTSSNAWITSSALDGEMANFWTFTANAGDSISLTVTSSAIEFGVSIYQGVVSQTELLFAGFNNAGDFGDNLFVAGTNPVTGALGTTLLNIILPTSGTYTIALGGEQGLSYDGEFGYQLAVQMAPVPLPAGFVLLASALLGGMGIFRRKAA